ncbi:hypothetical protein [Providencia rettgeri]|uniref:hypothetical protein n=1 Tax=Providencia rettgeri TaxID=587 RepID=UPI000F766884|nr:hypothetical protein [Providencia rettgeri]EJD6508462.1 hypothetical protein [Providencia rettgeri]ELR5255062.1 hypothetical protein [Providencia rettgeri]MBV2187630.1 hypothetical protein [Providencia rettgeri]MDH2379154.1 hypothetical protein [Providencia rettgeri]
MKRILAVAAVVALLAGCGGEKSASDKVMEFVTTENTELLSKSKIAACTSEGIKKITFIDKNVLPTTNDYYKLSDYLYGKAKYSIVSEKKDGDSYIVSVKWTYPKAIDDAKSFIEADSPYASERDKKDLDNLKALYESGGLDNLEYASDISEWTVLSDGIDPNLTDGNIEVCSK